MTVGRYLTRDDVARYLRVGRNMVDRLVQQRVIPKPIYLTPRLPRWDREAIDRAVAGGNAGASSSWDDAIAEVTHARQAQDMRLYLAQEANHDQR